MCGQPCVQVGQHFVRQRVHRLVFFQCIQTERLLVLRLGVHVLEHHVQPLTEKHLRGIAQKLCELGHGQRHMGIGLIRWQWRGQRRGTLTHHTFGHLTMRRVPLSRMREQA